MNAAITHGGSAAAIALNDIATEYERMAGRAKARADQGGMLEGVR
jgi:hypothetical protein